MKTAHIVLGLGFGDEGKGLAVDYFCRKEQADLVVRYNGGSQAAHNVVTPEGQHFTFSQIGSGSFNPNVKTLLSQYMLFDPITFVQECDSFSVKFGGNILNRIFIDGRVKVITPFHVAVNRIKEMCRGNNRHGSCGKGIGETVRDSIEHPNDVISVANLKDCAETLAHVQARLMDIYNIMARERRNVSTIFKTQEMQLLLNEKAPAEIAETYESIFNHLNVLAAEESNELIRKSNVIFEGAQGVLLDENFGFHPYTTWSSTTQKNALQLLKDSNHPQMNVPEVTGVIRTFLTRHGPGPFPTEDKKKQISVPKTEHNVNNVWQRDFRIGAQDLVLLKYAVDCIRSVGNLSNIFLTHCDREKFVIFTKYGEIRCPFIPKDINEQVILTNMLSFNNPSSGYVLSLAEFTGELEDTLNVKLKYKSFGQRANDVKE